MTHELKTWPAPFADIVRGAKTFEFRRIDRPYSVGDHLLLREYDPEREQYTGAEIAVRVTHMLVGPAFGIPDDYACMSVRHG